MSRHYRSCFPSLYRQMGSCMVVGIAIVQFLSSSSTTTTTTALAADLKSFNAFGVGGAALKSNLVSTGLRNLGNTCYMNAQLQCAFHIPKVRDIILTEEDEDEEEFVEDDEGEEETEDEEEEQENSDSNNEVNPAEEDNEEDNGGNENVKVRVQTNEPTTSKKSAPPPPQPPSAALLALRELFETMMYAADGKLPAVLPRSFCIQLGIPPMVQQDSQEFWKLLLPAVNKEELSDLYKGTFEDYITALDGSGRERRREELFLDLSLDISSSSTLLDSIKQAFGDPELLSVSEGNGWRPEKGADKVDAHKGSSLVAKGLPSILQFHLKRFNYDWNTDMTSKLNNRLEFPEELDLSKVCKTNDKDDCSLTVYDLQSVVIHMGEYGVGHYYAYVRPDIRKDTWYRFNDDIVEEVSLQDVLDDAYGGRVRAQQAKGQGSGGGGGGGGGPFGWLRRLLQNNSGESFGYGGRTSNAYVLQYTRRADQSMLYPTTREEEGDL